MKKTNKGNEIRRWYSIDTLEKAKITRLPALLFSIFAGLIWTIIGIGGLFGESSFGNWSFLYAGIMILIAYGLFKMRREAAIAGVILYCVGFPSNWGTSQAIQDATMIFIQGIALYGTIAFARLRSEQ